MFGGQLKSRLWLELPTHGGLGGGGGGGGTGAVVGGGGWISLVMVWCSFLWCSALSRLRRLTGVKNPSFYRCPHRCNYFLQITESLLGYHCDVGLVTCLVSCLGVASDDATINMLWSLSVVWYGMGLASAPHRRGIGSRQNRVGMGWH